MSPSVRPARSGDRFTTRISEAYQRLVDHDFVGQYLGHYVEGMEARAF